MLAGEGLVPTPPLDDAELGARWADSWNVVRRYSEFFRGCKEAIAEALSANAFPNRSSVRGDWVFQDYGLEDTSSVAVGMFCTDELEKQSPRSRSPILWVAVSAEHLEQWDAISATLAAHRPGDWRDGNPWYGRPTMWRPLPDVVGEGTLEEQRSRLASAAADGRRWLEDGIARGNATTPNPRATPGSDSSP